MNKFYYLFASFLFTLAGCTQGFGVNLDTGRKSGYMGQTSATDGVCGDFVVKI